MSNFPVQPTPAMATLTAQHPPKNIKPSRIGRVAVSSWQTPDTAKQLRILAAEQETTQSASLRDRMHARGSHSESVVRRIRFE